MTEIKNREDNPAKGIEYSEIYIPDEENLGSGTFTILLEKEAIVKIVPIVSMIMNEPVFLLMANINYEDDEVTVLLGRADNTPPLSREVFMLPKKIDASKKITFEIAFADWKITGVKMDGGDLEKVLPKS